MNKKIELINMDKLYGLAFLVRDTSTMLGYSEDNKFEKAQILAYKNYSEFAYDRFWKLFFEKYPQYLKGYNLAIKFYKSSDKIEIEIKSISSEEKKLNEVIADLDFTIEGRA